MDYPPVTLTLPFPPTVNTYYRNVNGRTMMSKGGRMYRGLAVRSAQWQMIKPFPANARLEVILSLYPDNRRKWDIDNRAKACLDALQHAGVIPDDEQIDKLVLNRMPLDKDSRVEITISVIRLLQRPASSS